jgi:chromosome segregation and condensation protein ScpB
LASGRAAPRVGALVTYVTTQEFSQWFGLTALRDKPRLGIVRKTTAELATAWM